MMSPPIIAAIETTMISPSRVGMPATRRRMARMRVNGVPGHAPLPPTDHVVPGTYSVTCLIPVS